MRFLLPISMKNELQSRKSYLYDSLHIWTNTYQFDSNFYCLEGFPFHEIDILFIVGHNYDLLKYLTSNLDYLVEKTIVAITCDGKVDFSSIRLKNKILFIPHQNEDNYADLLHGTYYGFNYDLTESEILFFNSRKLNDINKRLDSAFTRVTKP